MPDSGHEVLVDALDLTFSVRGLRGADRADFADLWQDCRGQATDRRPIVVDVGATASGHLARCGGQEWHLAGADSAVAAASAAVNVTANRQTPLLAMHAAVLTRGSTTLVIPGASGQGKSTLAVALLQLGWSYVSDETLALDWASTAVRPYPRPIAVSDWTAVALALPRGLRSAGELWLTRRSVAADIDPRPGQVSAIVTLERASGRPQMLPLHRADALAELFRRGFTHHRDPARALRLLAELTLMATTLRLQCDDPVAAAWLVGQRTW